MHGRRLRLVLVPVFLGSLLPASAQTTAFVGGRVIDGTGRVFETGVVVVSGGRITSAGPGASTAIPPAAARVDVTGKTVMPGLVNAHGHLAATVGLRSNPASYTRANLERQLRTYAQYGVATVFSLGDDQAAGFALRDEPATAGRPRARLFVAGPVVGGGTADEARAEASAVIAMKPDLLKIRVDDNLGTGRKMPEPAWRAVLDQAKAAGLRVAVHVFYLADAAATVAAGAGFVGHSVRDRAVDETFAAALTARDVCYCPTLTREVSTFVYGSTPPWAADPFFLAGVDPEVARLVADPARQAQVRAGAGWQAGQQYKAGLAVAMRNLKFLADRGVRIAFGTDSGPPGRFQGFFEHLELEMMVEAGLSPMQALVSATGDAARCHNKAGEFGTLTPGAAADLLILGANPLQDIRNSRTIEQVWLNGARAF